MVTSLEAKARVPHWLLILTASIDLKYAPIAAWNSVSHLTYFSLSANDWNQSHEEGLWILSAAQWGQEECEIGSWMDDAVECCCSCRALPLLPMFLLINHHYLIASHPAAIRNRVREAEPGAAKGTWCVEANPKQHSADLIHSWTCVWYLWSPEKRGSIGVEKAAVT